MIRVHETSHLPPHAVEDIESLTRTWLARPRNTVRSIDLSRSPNRSERTISRPQRFLTPARECLAFSREILGDLLERYAGLSFNSLKKQIDGLIDDESRLYEHRENLHYLASRKDRTR